MPRLPLTIFTCALLTFGAFSSSSIEIGSATAQERLESYMENDPAYIPPDRRAYFPDGLRELWVKALQRPEAEMKVRAADAFSAAYELGFRDLEGVGELLLKQFLESPHLTVRQASARALAQIDYHEASPEFFAAINSVPFSISQVIEPALAKWENEDATGVWLRRLESENWQIETQVLAIRCLIDAQATQAIPQLEKLLVEKAHHRKLRLATAKALAELQPEKNGQLAEQLYGDGNSTLVERMIAADLLSQTTSKDDLSILHQMANDEITAIGLISLNSIYRIDRNELKTHLESMQASTDVGIRRLAANWHTAQENDASIDVLLSMLNDDNPDLRNTIRRELTKFVKAEKFKDQILTECSSIAQTASDSTHWQAIEQALFIVTAADYKPAALKLPDRLKSERAEVSVTSAWALSRLLVPETFPAMVEFAAEMQFERVQGFSTAEDETVSHLLQGLGVAKYSEAEEVMRLYVPKQIQLRYLSRAAAIWSLGLLHENESPADLASAFEERLNDRNSMVPEFPWVRHMCAVSLGRMKCEETLESLQQSATLDGMSTPQGQGANWAVNQITGAPIPPVPPEVRQYRGWFLEPLQASDGTIE